MLRLLLSPKYTRTQSMWHTGRHTVLEVGSERDDCDVLALQVDERSTILLLQDGFQA